MFSRIRGSHRSVDAAVVTATILAMSKAELHRQIDSMTEEEAAEVKLIFAPDWPSKATSIEEIRKRTGTTPMSPENFDRHFGSLPTDGEG